MNGPGHAKKKMVGLQPDAGQAGKGPPSSPTRFVETIVRWSVLFGHACSGPPDGRS